MINEIVEMIFKEARAREDFALTTRTYMVLSEVSERISEMLLNFQHEERRKKDDENEG